ncbi:MAG: tetratricopeptide repeat protein [Deltaproteobacteria bacterium]|nr:tetratricopeptide repeat protein [Deltaproteobacteria bacterium]
MKSGAISSIATLVLSATLVVSGCGSAATIEHANELSAQRQYRAAAKLLFALSDSPASTPHQALAALDRLASIQAYHLEEPTAARTTLLRAMELSSTPADAHLAARRAATISVELLDDPAGAVEVYLRLVNRFPVSPEAQLSLGRAALSAGKLDLAEDALRFASSKKELEPEVLESLASLYIVEGRLREATDALATLTEHPVEEARRAEAQALAAHCHEALGELGLAEELYARAGSSSERDRVAKLRSRSEGTSSARP